MARKYEIGIAADTGGFEKSIQNGLVDPLEEAADAFDDLESAAKGADLDRELDKAQDASEDLADELDDARDQLKKLGYAAKDAGDDAKKGMARAEEGVKGFKQEAAQSARETAASFDGSFESIAELGQEVAANAFADFGPAGVAAGLAVAAAAGVMVNHFNDVQEAADEARDSAFSLAYDVSGALSAAGYTQRVGEWTSETEKFKQVTDLANVSGWDQVDVIDALSSGGPKLDKLSEAFAANGMSTMVTSGRLRELEAVIKATNEGYISGADAAALAERTNYQYAMTVGVATGEVDALGNAIYRLPGETEVAVNAHTQTATEEIQRVGDAANNVPDAEINARVNGLNQVRIDLDALTKPRTVSVTAKLNAQFAQSMGWDK